MNRNEQENKFIHQTKARLDQSEQQLDHVTLGRLRAARREALQSKRRPAWQLPAAAFATLVLCAVLVTGLMRPAEEVPGSVEMLEDIALLTAQEELEMYEDMDLILWLLEQEDGADLG